MKNKKILIIAAHPDDEVLGCGGTIAQLAAGNTIHALILVDRITSRKTIIPESELKELRETTLKAHEVLGIKHTYFENFPDNSFDKVSLLEIVKKIDEYVKRINPDIIFTHHYGDLNIDHRLTFEAVLVICRPQPTFHHPDIYCFEIPSSTEWQVFTCENMFKPNIFIDISSTIEKKIEVLKIYKNEMRDYPHSRSIKGIKIMAQDWGRKFGRNYIEAFELIRSIRDQL
ncbi:MAG: PIG-L deacetylase family protein [Promethearchaeota archaeon]